MITWPASLPLPEREGYSYALPDLTLRSQFALGSRVRKLYADGPDTFTVSVDLTPPEVALLQGFLRFEAANGSAWFDMPILASGAIEQRSVRLLSPPTFSLVGAYDFRVAMQLETRIGTTMDAATWEAFSAFPDPVTAFADLQALEDFVNSASGPPAFALSFADDGDSLLFSDSGSTLDFTS
jgi:hypothetical protein